MLMRKTLLFATLSLVAFQAVAGIVITKDTEIVVGEQPSYVAQFAAEELSRFLGKALGQEMAVKSTSTAPVRIYVGIIPDGISSFAMTLPYIYMVKTLRTARRRNSEHLRMTSSSRERWRRSMLFWRIMSA